MKCRLVACVGVVCGLAWAAEPAAAEPAPRVGALTFVGLDRTDESVVQREVLLTTGEPFDEAALAESVQRLKNLLLFGRVEAETVVGEDGAVDVTFHVDEKWTIIPVVRFGGGGGSTFFVLGAYDINVAGRYLEVGGQYQNLNGSHSGVGWVRDPRFLGQRLLVGADVWSVTQVRRLYTLAGELDGAWAMDRLKLNALSEVELGPDLRLGAGAELLQDSFSTGPLNDEERAVAAGDRLPDEGRTVLGRLSATLGHLDYDDYLVEGLRAIGTAELATGVWGSQEDLYRLTLDARGFLRLPWRSNLGARLSVGHTNTTADQHLFYIGGLDYKRGFLDGQFRGQDFWDLNTEFRIPSLETAWIVLQHDVFFDIGDVANSMLDLVTLYRAPCMSAGTGIRVISPKIYRLVLRLDYAVSHAVGIDHGISFGVQQFF